MKRGALGIGSAVWYREIRSGRAIYVTGWALMIAPWVIEVIQYHPPDFFSLGISLASKGLYFDILVAGLMGLLAFQRDRASDFMTDVLEGPVSRRTYVGAKALALGGVVLTADLVSAILVFSANWAWTGVGALGPQLSAAAWLAGASLAVAMTGLAMSAITGSFILAALGCLIWPIIPSLASSAAGGLFYQILYPYPDVAPKWAKSLVTVTGHLSPFSAAPIHGSLNGGLYSLWFLAIALALGYGAVVWFEHAQMERWHEAVAFEFLWSLFYALVSLFLGAVAMAVVGSPSSHVPVFFALWIALSAVLWFVVRGVHRWMRSSLRGWKPKDAG